MFQEKILLVEDDPSLGETIKERLTKEGYKTTWCENLSQARSELKEFNPDLVILDLRLPDGSGFRLAEEMSKMVHPPAFLFLTAQAGAQERLRGFELGAEEFIPKPFHLKEFMIRLKKVLEKSQSLRSKKNPIHKDYQINLDGFCIVSPKGEKRELTKRDCLLLDLLIKNSNRAITRDEILDQLWGEDKFPTNRTVDNSIVRLRQALDDTEGVAIRSVRGVGYQWVGELD
ncbi:MAG: response regulator transcription factor [Leptospira sp.]|nr:response regulator transcription factor [Leptospira sp.]